MSPKLKRIFSVFSLLTNAFLTFIFLILMFEEADPFYMIFLMPLLASLFVAIDHLKEMNHKIKLSNDLKTENQLMKDAAAARAFSEQRAAYTQSASPQSSPFSTSAEEEQNLADLLRARNNNSNQTYNG